MRTDASLLALGHRANVALTSTGLRGGAPAMLRDRGAATLSAGRRTSGRRIQIPAALTGAAVLLHVGAQKIVHKDCHAALMQASWCSEA